MSMTLQMPPELEAMLRADAQKRGVEPEMVAIQTLSSYYEARQSADVRREAKARLRGSLKGKGPTVDDFLAERSAEARKEIGV